jgi:hypothetical protein
MNKELILGRKPLEQINRAVCILKPEVVGMVPHFQHIATLGAR